MTTQPLQQPLDSKHIHIVAVASLCAGVAFFDFALFIYLPELLSAVFFGAADDDWLYQFQLFTLFATGYLAQPIGGLLLGRFGDAYGRKPALSTSIFGVMIFTLIMAFIPSHHSIGIAAPLILIVARFFQGLSMGGLLPSAWTFTTEHLPSKNLGLGCGIVCATCMLFLLTLMGLIGFLESTLTFEQMLGYGWRVLFVIGGVISLSAFLLVRYTQETPIFTAISQNNETLHSYIDGINLQAHDTNYAKPLNSTTRQVKKTLFYPQKISTLLQSIVKHHTFALGTTILTAWIITSLMTFIPMLLAPLLVNHFYISNNELYFGSVIALIFMVIGSVFFGFLTDRFDAGRTLVFGGLFLIIQVAAFFNHLQSGGEMILILFALLGFANGLIGALPAMMTRLFPAKIRLTGIGLSFNLVASLIGGILPFVLGYVSFYYSFVPALYLALIGVLTIFISFFVYYIPRSERDLSR